LDQQTIDLVISGYASPEQAAAAFRREIVTLIDSGTKHPGADACGSVGLETARRQ